MIFTLYAAYDVEGRMKIFSHADAAERPRCLGHPADTPFDAIVAGLGFRYRWHATPCLLKSRDAMSRRKRRQPRLFSAISIVVYSRCMMMAYARVPHTISLFRESSTHWQI